jgi:phosphohistidine phosphatase
VSQRQLLVMRHAQAEHGLGPDQDRARTAEGCAEATAAGERLVAAGLVPDLVICSTARRAHQTWEYVQAALPRPVVVDFDKSLYGAGVDEVVELVTVVPDKRRTVLLVGHNPTMAQLAAHLAGAFDGADDAEAGGAASAVVSFPPGSVAVLELDVAWQHVAEGVGYARML